MGKFAKSWGQGGEMQIRMEVKIVFIQSDNTKNKNKTIFGTDSFSKYFKIFLLKIIIITIKPN